MTNLHHTHPTRLRRGTASAILPRMMHRRIGSALVSLIALSPTTGCGGAWYESWGIQSEAELSQPASIPKLIQALDDPMFACSAAGHLGGLGADAKDAVPKLKAMLGRCYWHGARNSASAAAATALVKIAGPEALPALVEGLASPSFSHRAECTIGLLQLGPAAASAVPQLLVALGDPEWAGRWLAAKALGAIGPGAGPATSALALALKDQGDWYIRAEAADALGAIGVASPEVVAALEERVNDQGEDSDVHEAATNALRRLKLAAANGTAHSDTRPTPVVATVTDTPPKRSARIVVAVFDVEDSAARFDQKILGQLTEYLAVKVSEVLTYRVIPREQLRARLRTEKAESYKQCVDETCQIELGKALAAERTIATKLLQIGNVCAMTSTLLDLRTETTERAASVKTSCDDNGLINGIDQLVTQLAAQRPEP